MEKFKSDERDSPEVSRMIGMLNAYDEQAEANRGLLLAAKEAAIMLAELAKAANQSPRGPGFNQLMAAIKRFEAAEIAVQRCNRACISSVAQNRGITGH